VDNETGKHDMMIPRPLSVNRPLWEYFERYERQGIPEFTGANVKELKKHFRYIGKHIQMFINWQELTESGRMAILSKRDFAPKPILAQLKIFADKYNDLAKQAYRWQKAQKVADDENNQADSR